MTEADMLAHVLAALRERAALRGRSADVTAGELAEAMWLCEQGLPPLLSPADGDARSASSQTRAEDAPPGDSAGRGHDANHPRRSRQSAAAYPLERTGEGERLPSTVDWLPDAPALPRARELAHVLRPLRYDNRRIPRPGSLDIDEEATARQIARSGIRQPAWRASRRRRLDLDLVLDVGGSGPLWQQLALESRAMLERTGAFRSTRYWTLDTDDPGLALRAGNLDPEAPASPGTVLDTDTVCMAPRKPLVVVITDGTGEAWRRARVHEPLRKWAAYGTVVLIQVLPSDMWDRTALQAVPVTFFPASDGYQRGSRIAVDEVDLSVAGLEPRQLAAATAIPVVELDAAWLRYWLPLLRGPEAGAVPGYAYLIPPAVPVPRRGPAIAKPAITEPESIAPLPDPTPEQRVQRFLLSASGDAIRLARWLAVVEDNVNLAILRKLRQELLPAARPSVIAEVILSGLLYWTESAGTRASPGRMRFHWRERVYELLQARPGGIAQLDQDTARVREALLHPEGWSGTWYPVIRASSGAAVNTVPSGTRPLISDFPASTDRAIGPRPEAGPGLLPEPLAVPGSGNPAIRVGIWGSASSGRTTFLSVAAGIAGWQAKPDRRSRRHWDKDLWRVRPGDEQTAKFVHKFAGSLASGKFPAGNVPGLARQWSFTLERRHAGEAGPDPRRTVHLQDRSGGEFDVENGLPGALKYLAESDVLLYFFDPTYDDPWIEGKHSHDFFMAVEEYLGLVAATGDALLGRFLPQHLAVCIPKLDEQGVFDDARRYGFLDTDPDGLPWVSESKARLFFESICLNQHRSEADALLASITSKFHPSRISFHVLSSIGYWIPPDGRFNPADVCNVVPDEASTASGGEGAPRQRIRGAIRPLHVLDPIISLVERAEGDLLAKGAGRGP